jgi:hypothetical protein
VSAGAARRILDGLPGEMILLNAELELKYLERLRYNSSRQIATVLLSYFMK